MNAALHTHDMFDNAIEVDVHTSDKYTSLRIESTVYPRGVDNTTFVLPSEFTLHMGGLTIQEADVFIESLGIAHFKLEEWNNARMDDENEDVES